MVNFYNVTVENIKENIQNQPLKFRVIDTEYLVVLYQQKQIYSTLISALNLISHQQKLIKYTYTQKIYKKQNFNC